MIKSKSNFIYFLKASRKSNSSGYTLLEGIVALVVVGVLITSVAPMLALTTASRVQARRVNLAAQALRSYLDGLRGGTLKPPSVFIVTTPSLFVQPDFGKPPSTSLVNYLSNPDQGTLIDTNNNGFSPSDSEDLVIQAIRPVAICDNTTGTLCPIATNDQKATELSIASASGYRLAVRVYRADAFDNNQTPNQTIQANTSIGGVGSKNNPLLQAVVEIYPNIPIGTSDGLNSITARTKNGS
ncbi:hypothetical protein Syn7502_00436 [Synechococcus sp. PCC 7502]|uniref:prepilin-type N-terminal cleavage/methylation domain-containing protein n=1 Tax=Synechococcus sp. PCC 7502 TaxID=1173263 RepID=UPI00029FC475|nr:prepilin-type N-terminal cleavage/methylation domain-containing protein [Synechococcus sp. PCC 7502]AFY72596.1 hypothetical protein Syn7502_00436 [Synechococcus sp. PCC 7502]